MTTLSPSVRRLFKGRDPIRELYLKGALYGGKVSPENLLSLTFEEAISYLPIEERLRGERYLLHYREEIEKTIERIHLELILGEVAEGIRCLERLGCR